MQLQIITFASLLLSVWCKPPVHAPNVQRPPIRADPDAEVFKSDPSKGPIQLGGDMLNVTKCYCMLEDSEHFDRHAWGGYYYQWIYYNFHTDTWFNVSRYCRTRHTIRSKPPDRSWVHKINDCWSFWNENQQTPSCESDQRGNNFCTRVQWEDGDYYMYNDQTRSMLQDYNLAPEDEVEDKCNKLCGLVGTEEERERDGKMVMLNGKTKKELNHHINEHQEFRWSFIDTDYAVSDMCDHCE